MAKVISIIVCMFLGGLASLAHAQVSLSEGEKSVEISNATQRVLFEQDAQGVYQIATFVRSQEGWQPMFDGRRPLLEGSLFNLAPTSCRMLEDNATRKTVLLGGKHTGPDYKWSLTVQVEDGSPLIKFTMVCNLRQALTVDSPQPNVALWMNQPQVQFGMDQGPVSQTAEVYLVPFNFGFPAAYLWDNQREAMVFFNMTPMTWFAEDGIRRFIDVQIKNWSDNGQSALGMYVRHTFGPRIPAGPMVTEFYLYSGQSQTKPTKFEALDRMIKTFAPVHPAQADFPHDTFQGGEVSWDRFAGLTIDDLMTSGVACTRLTIPWEDKPLALVDYPSQIVVHPSLLEADQGNLAEAWNFSTVNHHLAPWLLYAQASGSQSMMELARLKKDAVARFYDPQTKMIRSFPPRHALNVQPIELSWQTLVFYQEILQLDETITDKDFNPAIIGRMLMGNQGLIEYAHNVNYLFSTYYNPATRQPRAYLEKPGLGAVREPWSVGAYAYVMMRSFELTGDELYLNEARKSMNTLLHKMSYTESNEFYTRTYEEAMDMPPTELTGNAYGAVAAWKLYEQTGQDEWKQVSRDFLNTLLRQSYWHEDNTDAVSRELGHAGLFYAYVGCSATTSWESSEAHMCISWMLGRDTSSELTPLLLKMANLARINGFYFYPAVFQPVVRALNPGLRRSVGQYFPVEPMYQLECTAGSVGDAGTAPYMAGHSIWNWWLYEALGTASDRSILVLNTASLEGNQTALSGARRALIAFNPNPGVTQFELLLKALPEGRYRLTLTGADGVSQAPQVMEAADLIAGLPLELGSLDYVRVELTRDDDGRALASIGQSRAVRNSLSRAYELLQEAATVQPTGMDEMAKQFKEAMQAYHSGDLKAAGDGAARLIEQVTRK